MISKHASEAACSLSGHSPWTAGQHARTFSARSGTRIPYAIEQHKHEGTTEPALDEALDRACTTYAKRFMGGCEMNGTGAVAARERIHLALERGRVAAPADP